MPNKTTFTVPAKAFADNGVGNECKKSEGCSSILVKPIITPKEGRKLLGKTGKNFTDDELIKLVNDMAILSRALLKWVTSSTNECRGV